MINTQKEYLRMKKIALAICSVLLVSCTPQEEKLKQTREDYSFTMNVEIVDEKDITRVCTELGVQYEANGCAKFDLDKKECTIYVMPQRYENDARRLELIGHETWHCVYGRWHD